MLRGARSGDHLSGTERTPPTFQGGEAAFPHRPDGWSLPAAPAMSAEDLEKYETEMELQLYREYRDVVGLFSHVVETERRFYLTNQVELNVRTADNGEVFFEVTMQDAWVWDMYRPARFVKNVRVVTFKDVNVEELARAELEVPDDTK